LVEFLVRTDAALFYALQDGRIAGTAACVLDQLVMHFAYFAVEPSLMDALAPPLLSAVEDHARAVGATLVTAALPRTSAQVDQLFSRGYEIDWEEPEARAGRVVPMVDLIKRL
jgi:hypothetical protein